MWHGTHFIYLDPKKYRWSVGLHDLGMQLFLFIQFAKIFYMGLIPTLMGLILPYMGLMPTYMGLILTFMGLLPTYMGLILIYMGLKLSYVELSLTYMYLHGTNSDLYRIYRVRREKEYNYSTVQYCSCIIFLCTPCILTYKGLY